MIKFFVLMYEGCECFSPVCLIFNVCMVMLEI